VTRLLIPLLFVLLLLACAFYLFFVSIGGLPHDAPPGAFIVQCGVVYNAPP